jgi:hypothetical protein
MQELLNLLAHTLVEWANMLKKLFSMHSYKPGQIADFNQNMVFLQQWKIGRVSILDSCYIKKNSLAPLPPVPTFFFEKNTNM